MTTQPPLKSRIYDDLGGRLQTTGVLGRWAVFRDGTKAIGRYRHKTCQWLLLAALNMTWMVVYCACAERLVPESWKGRRADALVARCCVHIFHPCTPLSAWRNRLTDDDDHDERITIIIIIIIIIKDLDIGAALQYSPFCMTVCGPFTARNGLKI